MLLLQNRQPLLKGVSDGSVLLQSLPDVSITVFNRSRRILIITALFRNASEKNYFFQPFPSLGSVSLFLSQGADYTTTGRLFAGFVRSDETITSRSAIQNGGSSRQKYQTCTTPFAGNCSGEYRHSHRAQGGERSFSFAFFIFNCNKGDCAARSGVSLNN